MRGRSDMPGWKSGEPRCHHYEAGRSGWSVDVSSGACVRAGAYFSVTDLLDPAVKAAIAAIGEDAWTPIRYPRAIWDDQLGCWASIHGVRLEERPGRHRPADRAPGPRPEPQGGGPGRAWPRRGMQKPAAPPSAPT